MFRRLMSFVLFAALVVPVLAEDQAVSAGDKKTGYALLDALGQMFHQMAMTGTGGAGELEKGIQKFMADAKKAKDQKQINPVFFRRYTHLLAVIKLVMGPDPGGILTPLIDRELSQFVGYVVGEEWKGKGPGSIGQVAEAIAYEIIDLQMYLDNLEAREKLRQAWDDKFSDAAPKKKEPETAIGGAAPIK
jgi:hypothetical protein